jgi:hypothetical protein
MTIEVTHSAANWYPDDCEGGRESDVGLRAQTPEVLSPLPPRSFKLFSCLPPKGGSEYSNGVLDAFCTVSPYLPPHYHSGLNEYYTA